MTSPVTTLDAAIFTEPLVELTSPRTVTLPSVTAPLLTRPAALPWLEGPYAPSEESKLSITPDATEALVEADDVGLATVSVPLT